jgi:hypothetical protein
MGYIADPMEPCKNILREGIKFASLMKQYKHILVVKTSSGIICICQLQILSLSSYALK